MTLNIFTDASIIKTIYGETIGCAGAITIEDPSLNRFEILRDSTNNISEISAIALAVRIAIENRQYDTVNIISDSQWSIFGLTKWNRSWMKNMSNYIMKNSSGESVKNQCIFLSIMKSIIVNNIKINFYHTKGHVDVYNMNSINHACSVFYKSNGITISRNNMFTISNMNNLVDDKTRQILNDFKEVRPINLVRGLVNPIISKEDLNTYYNLVTLGGKAI